MRIANLNGRAVLTDADTRLALDIERASDGRFGADPGAVYERWSEFAQWARQQDAASHRDAVPVVPADLGPVVPRPPQILAVGLNYADHAEESNMTLPEHPMVFTKFASSLAGPDVDVELSGDTVDWEIELVAVVGVGGRDIPAERAWDHVAGLTVGQDLSDRTVQFQSTPPQFNLGKSLRRFAPVGPAVVTVDELRAGGLDPDDLALRCTLIEVDGTERVLQQSRTAQLIFSIPDLVARLSASVELLPGDLIFTGTPSGVGFGRTPREYLVAGQTVVSEIDGLGSIRQRFVVKEATA
ncbi:fumarylacetoacetate hydrolase family protein [Agromyces intestinalis]|uniref:Fumarylacetoacetate hydrolase family protein n=1 Tax=Agromyces intestinalis TaxID=2592652 RepID=A0A5C1YCR5_9MICO|nr:fumarylacetoacetate hydrolase family protein [Agromyces intestinalis]QEO13883.1 fumarylacetoacetate hydrolase family protein [Agromyces intestinalis]